jgi:integrase
MPQYKKELKRGTRWFYKFSYKGKIYRSDAVYLSMADARKDEKLRVKEVEWLASNVNQNNDMTLLELINLRLDYIQVAKTEKYYEETKYYLSMLFKELGDVSVQQISSAIILNLLIEFSAKQKKKGLDNYSVNALLRVSKALFNHGIKIQKLNFVNPCFGIKMFPVKKKLKYIPTDEEIEEVLEKCTYEQKQLVEFVRDTGCRISEALYLRADDVFEDYVVLYTKKSKNGNMVPRKVNLDTSSLMQNHLLDGRVFSRWNITPKFLEEKIRDNNFKKWNWHNLRHRYASKLSKEGTPIFEIMSLLGHSNLETTQNYLQLLP